MDSNGTKRNTGKSNIDAEDKIDGQPIDVEIPVKDITIKHYMHLRQQQSKRIHEPLCSRGWSWSWWLEWCERKILLACWWLEAGAGAV